MSRLSWPIRSWCRGRATGWSSSVAKVELELNHRKHALSSDRLVDDATRIILIDYDEFCFWMFDGVGEVYVFNYLFIHVYFSIASLAQLPFDVVEIESVQNFLCRVFAIEV